MQMVRSAPHTRDTTQVSQGNGTAEKVFKTRKVLRVRFERTDRGSMMDRNGELVPEVGTG